MDAYYTARLAAYFIILLGAVSSSGIVFFHLVNSSSKMHSNKSLGSDERHDFTDFCFSVQFHIFRKQRRKKK